MKDKLKALWDAIVAQSIAAWAKISAYTFIVGILAGIIFIIAKYRDILIDLIVGSAKRDVDAAQKKDDALKATEDAAKAQANQLVQKANDLDSGKTPVSDDWNKK